MKKHILYKLLSLFCVLTLNVQAQKIDSLYQLIGKIETKKDFEKFTTFHLSYQKALYDNTYKSNVIFETKYLEALKWAENQQNEKLLNKVKFYVLRFYSEEHNDKEIITRANELIQINSFFNTKDIVKTYSILAQAYDRTEQFSELLNIYPIFYKQIKKHKLEEFEILQSAQHRTIGLVYYRLNNFNNAIKEFKKRAKYNKTENDIFGVCSAENDIGLCFLRLNKWDSAMYYFDKSLTTWHSKAVQKEMDDYRFHFKNIINANKASVLMQQKKYDKALPFLMKELASSKIENDYYTMIPAYHKIAVMYFKTKKNETALKYIDSTEKVLKKFNNNEIKMKSFRLKAKCLLVKGNIDKANNYFKIYETFKDSLETIKAENRHIAATVQYETVQKEKELLLSNHRNEVQKAINKYQKIAIVLISIGLISIFLFLRKTIKDKKVISKQKFQAEKNSEEKDILLKEVHHRVKNNLQVINSILDIQNSKIDDTRFNKILEEGQNRIQSMALIHQQLYQSDNLTDILMEKYIKDLVDNIARFNTNNKIDFTILANQIKFKISTSVPLGLIINELITNIYKHAFKKGEKGEVIIGINKIKENHFKLIVKDNGKGFPKNFDFDNTDSLGVKLINILTKQLKGNIIYSNDNGSKCEISFRDDVAV